MANTFKILDKKIDVNSPRRNGVLTYTGVVYIEDGNITKEDFLDALDANNFGGTVDFHKTDKPNVYTFVANVYID
jgi:hypothetical protein